MELDQKCNEGRCIEPLRMRSTKMAISFHLKADSWHFLTFQEVNALSGGRWSWVGEPKEIHTDIEFAMNEVYILHIISMSCQRFCFCLDNVTGLELSPEFYRVVNINLSGVLLLLGWSNHHRDCLLQTRHVRCCHWNRCYDCRSYNHAKLCNVRQVCFWLGGRERGWWRLTWLLRRTSSSWYLVGFCVYEIIYSARHIAFHSNPQLLCLHFLTFLTAWKLCRRLNMKALQAQEQSASSQESKRQPSYD